VDYVTDHLWTGLWLLPAIAVIGWRVVRVVRAGSGNGDTSIARLPRLTSLNREPWGDAPSSRLIRIALLGAMLPHGFSPSRFRHVRSSCRRCGSWWP
jgi:hypothetical protein